MTGMTVHESTVLIQADFFKAIENSHWFSHRKFVVAQFRRLDGSDFKPRNSKSDFFHDTSSINRLILEKPAIADQLDVLCLAVNAAPGFVANKIGSLFGHGTHGGGLTAQNGDESIDTVALCVVNASKVSPDLTRFLSPIMDDERP